MDGLAEDESCRFRPPKSAQEEDSLLVQSKPKSTQYKDKWAVEVFRTWQAARKQKFCILDPGSVFKDHDLDRVQSLEEKLEDLDSLSLNYWLTKFVQEVANKNGGRYPPRSLYGIVCGLKRHLEDVNGGNALNPLDSSDKRFAIFRRCLDAEMKDATREGVSLETKKEGKEADTDEEEELFWSKGLLGCGTAKSLLNTVYYYNGKIFGMRGSEHRKLSLKNFELGSNFIKFEENLCKTFHGGLTDLKYVPKRIKHICHNVGEKHNPCLLEVYRMYIGLVECNAKETDCFYLSPAKHKFSFEKSPVGINTLNAILPNMCKEVGIKRKTAHSLRIACATKLFNSGVEEKLIRERTGHRSNALLTYEKPSLEQSAKLSNLLGPCTSSSVTEASGTGSTVSETLEIVTVRAECLIQERF